MRRRRLPLVTPHSRLEGMLTELLAHVLPAEPRATCSDCAMASEEAPEGDNAHFHATLKCCTFAPRLPNFLVGDALADKHAREGGKRLKGRIARRLGISPLGVAPTPREVRTAREMDDTSFGRAKTHVCPYLQLDDGRCSVWRHRNSVCTTWFCKHEHGAVSLRFWEGAKEALGVIEHALSEHCVLVLDADRTLCLSTLEDERRAGDRTRRGGDDAIDAVTYAKLWGAWRGRELEFFARSAEIVASLSTSDILRLGGAPLALALERVRRAQDALANPRPPTALRRDDAITIQLAGRDAVAISSYRKFDVLHAPKAILDVLPLFDGRPVAQVLRQARRRTGLEIDDETLRQLVDFEILREVE